MKKLPLYSLLVVAGLVGIQTLSAQTQSTVSTTLNPEAQIAAAQASYDAWDQPDQPIGPNHRTTVRTAKTGPRRIVEIGTGMNYWNGLQWVPSNPTFVPVANGFVASQLQDPVQLAGDLYTTNAVTVRTPEGIILGSSPVAVALYDAASGNFAVIATVTNCQATLVESNQVLYPDAFSGNVCASVVYTISQGTFHQDVVFTGPLDPADYGFPRDTTRIQIITEFYGAPTPDELTRPLYVEANAKVRAKMASPDLIDHQLGFGRFVMTTGRAYVAPSVVNPNGLETPVAKEYKKVGDGTYLFESVPYTTIAAALSNLPPCHPSFGSTKIKSTKGYANIPRPGNKPYAGPLMARASHAPVHGVVVDYVANVDTPMNSAKIFQGDYTYLVSQAVFCNGPTTIEGGAVFKYKTGTSITLNSTLTCKTGQYRPAIFTAVDDDSVGDTMYHVDNSGYTGHISSSGYANPALYAPSAMKFTGLRIRYAQEAIKVYGFSGFTWSVSHAQFVNCIKGIEIQGGGCGCGCSPNNNFNVNNCLFSRVTQPILGTSLGGTVALYASLVNATVDHASTLGTSSCGVNLYIQSTNSIYASVSSSGGVTASGTKNAFYSDGFNFGSSQVTVGNLPNSPFQTVGAGNYYLTSTSNLRDAGTVNGIPAALLADLAKRTTYPPTVTFNTTLSANTALPRQVNRDTDVPDLGFHYDPIDYAFGNVTVANASVTASGGAVIATFSTNNSTYGLGFGGGSSFSSIGTPNFPNWIVLFNTVQEGTNLNWQRLANSVVGPVDANTSAHSIFTRFTSWSVLAQDAAQFNAPGNSAQIAFQDSEFHGGLLSSSRPTINLTNCLLERVNASLTTSDGNSPYIRNNLFFGGTFNFAPSVSTALVMDNLFDQTTIPNNSINYIGGYNAFITGNNRLLPTFGSDIVLPSSPVYQTGPLGSYYQAANSQLINADQTTTADQVGLYYYTETTNLMNGLEVKEANSQLDIGYHYIATDASGNPIDTDGNGLPDWWEQQHFGHNGVDPNADPDNDGLSNLQEYQNNTDPNNPDTDNDGLSDGAEVQLGTDPNNPDTDGDGLSDGLEVQLGTDPKNAYSQDLTHTFKDGQWYLTTVTGQTGTREQITIDTVDTEAYGGLQSDGFTYIFFDISGPAPWSQYDIYMQTPSVDPSDHGSVWQDMWARFGYEDWNSDGNGGEIVVARWLGAVPYDGSVKFAALDYGDRDYDGLQDGYEIMGTHTIVGAASSQNDGVADGDATPQNDGISNQRKWQYGLNPLVLVSETDSSPANGLPDWLDNYITQQWGSSADTPWGDADGDKLPNIVEYDIGTDPAYPDYWADLPPYEPNGSGDESQQFASLQLTVNYGSSDGPNSPYFADVGLASGPLGESGAMTVSTTGGGNGVATMDFEVCPLDNMYNIYAPFTMTAQPGGYDFQEPDPADGTLYRDILLKLPDLAHGVWEEVNEPLLELLHSDTLEYVRVTSMLKIQYEFRQLQYLSYLKTVDGNLPGIILKIEQCENIIHAKMTIIRAVDVQYIRKFPNLDWIGRCLGAAGLVSGAFSAYEKREVLWQDFLDYEQDVRLHQDTAAADILSVQIQQIVQEFAPLMPTDYPIYTPYPLGEYDGY